MTWSLAVARTILIGLLLKRCNLGNPQGFSVVVRKTASKLVGRVSPARPISIPGT